MMTDRPNSSPLSFGLQDAELGIRVKSPKLALGPLELGLSATYFISEAIKNGKQLSTITLKCLNPTVTVKDVLLRGKIELEPLERKLHYSKKLRLPFTNTELFKLRFTAQLPCRESAGGLLGRALGVSLIFQPERLISSSVVRKAPEYSFQLAPRLGPPQAVYDTLGFPGSIYLKANTTLHLSDAASVRDIRAHLDVHRVNAVVRLYDPARIKPCRLGRNLLHAARRLTLEDAEAEEEVRHIQAAVKVARILEAEQPQPDAIDRAAEKVREWAHAVVVNSCVATRHLQDQAAAAAEHVRSLVVVK